MVDSAKGQSLGRGGLNRPVSIGVIVARMRTRLWRSRNVDAVAESGRPRLLRYQVAFFLTALVTLALVVTLPFSVKSILDDILGPAVGRDIPITPRGAEPENTATSERLRSRQ